MREILSFQVGSYANFIGSYFWNFQDELLGLAEDAQADSVFRNQCLDMDLFYRTGETEQGLPTYTPRLVSIDFQGSLGSMSSHGTLYNQIGSLPSSVVTWTGNVSTQASKSHKKNLFLQSLYEEQKMAESNRTDREGNEPQSGFLQEDIAKSLENDVQFWTDFSKVHYHPQSLYELNGLWVDAQEFKNYGSGREAFFEGLRGDEINERLHFFMEECDHAQGIQYIVDDSGGFSGVASQILENIADEYTNIPVLLYSVRSPGSYMNCRSRMQTISHDLHDAVSFSRLSSLCKLIVPVGLPSLSNRRQEALVSEVTEVVQSAYEHAIARPKFSYLSVARCPLPIPLPFPSIFGSLIGQRGELLSIPISGSSSRGPLNVHSIPMAARLSSSNAILPFLEKRLGNLRKFGIAQGALGSSFLRNWGFGKEELEDIGEDLSKLVTTLDPD